MQAVWAVSHQGYQQGEAAWIRASQKVQAAKAEVGNGEAHRMGTHLLAARNAPKPPTKAAEGSLRVQNKGRRDVYSSYKHST